MRDLRRYTAVVMAALVVLSITTAPVAASAATGTTGKASGNAKAAFGVLGANIPEYAVTYGANGNPGWYVYTTENKTSAVEEWANQSTERMVHSVDAEDNRVLVSAPSGHVGGSLVRRVLGQGLVSQSYVTGYDLHIRMENVAPVDTLKTEDQYSVPLHRKVGVWTARGSASLNTDGVAFGDEVNRTNLSSVKTVTATDSVHAKGINGTGISAAVIDTGCNVASGEVFGNGSEGSAIRITHAYNTITETKADLANDSYAAIEDGNGHGTWVGAAAVGANGMAPNADVQCYKALSDDGSGSTEDIIEAVDRADSNGADVLLMSLGSPVSNPALADELRDALKSGNVTAISVAVGNSRQTTRWVASPADVSEVIGVAATNTARPSNASSAYFSNVGPDAGTDNSRLRTRGAMPDVAAPGMEITAEVPTADGRLINKTLSGTSMAQPFVGGGVVLLLDHRPTLINESAEVHNVTVNATSVAPNIGASEAGHGVLNVSNMIEETYGNTSQSEAADAEASGRDAANRALAGYPNTLPMAARAGGRA